VGSFLTERLLSEGWEIRVLDNLSTGRAENLGRWKSSKSLELVVADVKDSRAVQEAVKDVDVVFHLAANPEVRISTTDPEVHFKENVVGTFNQLEAMRIGDTAEHLAFASSSSVYGEPVRNPVGEDAQLKPASVYGATKAACEMLIMAYSELYNQHRAIDYARHHWAQS